MSALKSSFYVLVGRLDADQLAKDLRGRLPLLDLPETSRPFQVLDCHDQSLRAKGQILIEAAGTLRLVQSDGCVVVQKAKGKGKYVQDLPNGPVQQALRGFPELRALMVLGQGDLRLGSFAVLDDLQKTQVRGTVLVLNSSAGQVSLVTVNALRGYQRAYDAVCNAFQAMAANQTGLEPIFGSLFPDMTRYVAKPEIKLGTDERSIQVATDIISTYLMVARQNEAGTCADIDTEFLHDYRVSLRRIRSVLSLFKGVFSVEQTDQLKRQFSDLMAPTGRMRDLDVYLLEKDRFLSLIPASLHPGAEAMFDQFQKERMREFSQLSRRLRSETYTARMDDLAFLVADPENLHSGPNAERGAFEYACALIWKRYRKVCKVARSITDATPDAVVHDLRIDCKKLRYLMEFFAPLFDKKGFKMIIKPLKKLQDNLGLFNDCAVQQQALLSFVDNQNTTRNNAQVAMAAGGLIAILDQQQKAERQKVIANFQQFDSPEVRHLFRSLFHSTED